MNSGTALNLLLTSDLKANHYKNAIPFNSEEDLEVMTFLLNFVTTSLLFIRYSNKELCNQSIRNSSWVPSRSWNENLIPSPLSFFEFNFGFQDLLSMGQWQQGRPICLFRPSFVRLYRKINNTCQCIIGFIRQQSKQNGHWRLGLTTYVGGFALIHSRAASSILPE